MNQYLKAYKLPSGAEHYTLYALTRECIISRSRLNRVEGFEAWSAVSGLLERLAIAYNNSHVTESRVRPLRGAICELFRRMVMRQRLNQGHPAIRAFRDIIVVFFRALWAKGHDELFSISAAIGSSGLGTKGRE
jgi:hypothetical protein